ncbi:hypothetical protein [Halobacteriovorax sp. HLS]|uniref:hypothetical protein n=1 Tax=Halobacteriovorax sp. HLS TaxID=2234000 RepID=UPI000FD9FDE6|nr:hypothetical protein [Halobacteriovorax sp. HLS]
MIKQRETQKNKEVLIMHVVYMLSYFAICWAVYLLTSSTITFFHLQLDHTLTVVQNWNQDQGWEIASLVKIISFFVLFKFVSIRSISRRPLRDFFVNNFVMPDKRLFALIAFTLFFVVLSFRPVFANKVSFEFSKVFSSFIGSFIYLGCDIILLAFIHRIYPMSKKKRIIASLLFISLMFLLNSKVFIYSDYAEFSLLLYHAILIRLTFWKRLNWSYSFTYLTLCVCPMISFLGIDFIWGNDYSYFVANDVSHFVVYLTLFFVSFLYINFCQSKILDKFAKA